MCVTCCLEFKLFAEVFAQRGQLFTTLNLCFVASEVSHTLPCVSWLCVAVQVKPWLESWFQFCCFGSWETALGIDVRSPRGVLLVNIGICYSLWCHLPVHWQFQLYSLISVVWKEILFCFQDFGPKWWESPINLQEVPSHSVSAWWPWGACTKPHSWRLPVSTSQWVGIADPLFLPKRGGRAK